VSAASSAGPATTTSQARDLSNSGTLIPPHVHGEERLSFIAAQRERLSILLSALDKEANNIQPRTGESPAPKTAESTFPDGRPNTDGGVERSKSAMSSRKSETDFEKIEAESGSEEVESGKRPSGGSWLPWGWGVKPEIPVEVHEDTSRTVKTDDRGKSSGIEF
jgi:receptor expression-enhancing protein 1/2/3/4